MPQTEGLPPIVEAPSSLPAVPARPPAVVPPPSAPPRRRVRAGRLFALLLIAASAVGAGYWWLHSRPTLPPGIASGNGRLEADAIDIDTKLPGRIAEIRADEGDLVKAGQVVAIMDTRDLQAQLRQAQANVQQAQRSVDQAKAVYAQQEATVKLAEQEIERTKFLVPKGFASVETLDQRTQVLNAAKATLRADEAAISVAEHALDAATHQVEFYGVQIVDSMLTAPKTGPIEYRIANVGEVLPAGGKVFTLLDSSYVYMDIYLPTEQAGRVRIGSDARIVLDAAPARVIPARVVFVARAAQFTPKTVETKDEREKLMFRVRVRVAPDVLRGRQHLTKSGLPGVAYVKTDPNAAWPAELRASVAPPPRPS